MEDNDIVELFLARNEDAISRTAEKYGSRIRQIAYGVIGNHESAEECENDTYYKAWESIPPNEPREHLFSYLGRIVRNIALNRLKAEESKKRNAIRCELTHEIEVKRDKARQLYLEQNTRFANRTLGDSVTYISKYSPCIFANLSIDQIAELLNTEEILRIDYCQSGDFVPLSYCAPWR